MQFNGNFWQDEMFLLVQYNWEKILFNSLYLHGVCQWKMVYMCCLFVPCDQNEKEKSKLNWGWNLLNLFKSTVHRGIVANQIYHLHFIFQIDKRCWQGIRFEGIFWPCVEIFPSCESIKSRTCHSFDKYLLPVTHKQKHWV